MTLLFVQAFGILIFSSILSIPQVAASSDTKGRKVCYNVTLPLTVTSNNFVWALPKFKDNFDVGAFVQNINRRDAATSFVPFSGLTGPVTATYTIAGTFCKPDFGGVGTLLIASHGLLMDRYYWDSRFHPETYSFVDFVIAKGYSIFYYDRLGAGESQIISGYVNQATIQLEILKQLTETLRRGDLPRVPRYSPKKLVLVGHSFGSFLSVALMSMNSTVVDGALLTGMSLYGGLPQGGIVLASLQGRIASTLDPARFSAYDSAYTYCRDLYSCSSAFYKVPFFDPAAVSYFYNRSWPSAAMEQITILTINITATGVTAPVMFFNGEYDFVECGGYCPGVIEPAGRNAFPNSVGYQSYIQPDTGHILTYVNNATGGYQVQTDWLARNGL